MMTKRISSINSSPKSSIPSRCPTIRTICSFRCCWIPLLPLLLPRQRRRRRRCLWNLSSTNDLWPRHCPASPLWTNSTPFFVISPLIIDRIPSNKFPPRPIKNETNFLHSFCQINLLSSLLLLLLLRLEIQPISSFDQCVTALDKGPLSFRWLHDRKKSRKRFPRPHTWTRRMPS